MPEQSGHAPGAAVPRRYGARTGLLVLLTVLALLYIFLRGLGAFLITGDRLKKSAAVVPLGGGGEQRVIEAVRLMNQKYGSTLILTEPGEIEPGKGPGSQVFRMTAIDHGLSPNVIVVTDGVQSNTHDEALAVLSLMQKHKLDSVIVVTDPFHTQRTRIIFRDVFRGSGLRVRVHPVPNHWYRSSTWFLHAEGWDQTILEYTKLFGYWTGISHALD